MCSVLCNVHAIESHCRSKAVQLRNQQEGCIYAVMSLICHASEQRPTSRVCQEVDYDATMLFCHALLLHHACFCHALE